GGGGRQGGRLPEFDALGFLLFTKADLRPFLRVLLRTKAFEVFLMEGTRRYMDRFNPSNSRAHHHQPPRDRAGSGVGAGGGGRGNSSRDRPPQGHAARPSRRTEGG
ncbi:unnamed protein product, partial [Discosporangium mesarthrocarpum]